jgi:S-DNA-T family DNA segregation ATPase FtsK/SpoIIIE
MPTPPTFWRSPRFKPALPQAQVEIPPPPAAPSPPGALLPVLLPVGLMVVVMILVAAFQPGATTMLVLSVPMMLVGGVASLVTYRRQKQECERKTAERRQKYSALLDSYRDTLQGYLEEQQDVLLRKDPDPRQCLAWAAELSRHLWARGPDDDDFIELRLGLGSRPSAVTIKVPPADNVLDPDPLIRAAQDFAGQFRDVPGVPVCLALRQPGGTGLTGPRTQVLDVARGLVLQLAAHHSPDEVKIAAVYPAEEEAEWAWLRWLPHTWSDDRRQRFLANDKEGARRMFAAMNNLLNSRKGRAQESRGSELPAWPYHLVCLLADPRLTEDEPFVQRLQAEGATLGAHAVFLRERVRDLPKDCAVAVRLSAERAHVMLLEPKISHEFIPDPAPRDLAERFAAVMAPIRLRRPASLTDIPAALSLLELLQARTVEELNVAERWRKSAQAGRSLAVPIGVRGGGEPLFIDLHERAHGPNGLVAGMVGAGKSELLQTLVASLAVNYHPHRVAFVLVDYKGGGMADPFVRLPHTLGTITNLQQGNLAMRALTSFNVEAQRRQRLFAEAGVNHIDDYQRLYYKGQVKEPLPYLVIIVDEFAEMKTEQPDVAKEFVRIARIGRALGFRLILAMQKPAGIVDGQIEANTRFRLCLRVAQTEDSQAMLKRPDAAYLSGVGRAYFQVGANEIYDLFQVAWSGAPYDPSGFDADDPLEITAIALDGSRTALYRPRRSQAQADVTQLKALVEYLRQVAEEQSIHPLSGPWLPPLAEKIPLEEIQPRKASDTPSTGSGQALAGRGAEGWDGHGWQPAGCWLEPVVGLVDDPRQREQRPLRINLGKEGHLAVFGAPGYGTTTFVQTLVTSLARTYSPADVNLYLLDFGGRLLKLFEPLPHVGAVITADETERVERLLRYLLREMERRKERLGQAGVATLADYRVATGDLLPALVVVLDNYAAFVEANEEAEDALVQIAREGGNLGVHLVATAVSPTNIRYKVSSNITMAVALHLAESSEYAGIVGRTDGLFPPPVPGRGLVKGVPPLEFQTALPIGGQTDAERSAAQKALFRQMAAAWIGPRPAPVHTLPSVVPLADLLPSGAGWPTPDRQGGDLLAVPIGLDVADLVPFTVDLRAGPHFLIAGPAQSGKTSLLQTWLLALAEHCPPDRLHFYLLDSRRVGLAPLARLPHVRAYADDPTRVEQTLAELGRLLQERQGAIDAARRKAPAQADAPDPLARFPAVVVAVDDIFDQFDDNTTEDARQNLAALVRQGRRLGFHLIVAGSSGDLSSKGWSEPIKSLKETQAGFMLGISDDSVFNLRLPHGERDKVLPAGQAYWTQRGQSCKVQLATAQAGTPALDTWVKRLAERKSS